MPEHLLKPSYVPSVSHAVNRIRVPEGMGVDVFSNDRTIALDDVPHLPLFEGKDGPIIGELLCRNVFGEHFDRCCVQMHPPLLPSFRLRDVDHAVTGFDVARRDGEQLVDPYAGAPQHPEHEVVTRAALVRRGKHLIDLLFFEVVGDVLHALPKRSVIGNNGCYFKQDS